MYFDDTVQIVKAVNTDMCVTCLACSVGARAYSKYGHYNMQ